ncbi:beta-galactosidase [Cohnella sp. WQ 127256]|uniref:beta-galactosidase n=1 Tax=Cohnella sp. WQ 127256 TaxID=2938790 RepID=UPI002117F8CA|nr:beta-galactosidase [Cohnella sp. WQ 127256]
MFDNNNFSDQVKYDHKGFLIDGKRTFLVSGTIHYFRIPKELWRDRLEKARQFGLNCIETYVAWNVHEPEEGKFEFEENNDLEQFITLAKEYGLYVICRPGPYICAEWDFGGFPSWLLQKKGLVPRRNNAVYLKYVRRWFDILLSRLRPHLITVGGPIIMMQVENELANIRLDDNERKSYMNELVKMFRDNGIDVPYISCEGGLDGGLECINAHDPAERFAEYRSKYPQYPLFSTEFWPSWYSTWDKEKPEHERTPSQVEQATWKILSRGGAGYNYYMWHGGTNFGYRSMYLQTTSYFNEAPLNESGLFNECGRRTRRIARFATAMGETLADSESVYEFRESDNRLMWDNVDPELFLSCRSSQNGEIIFIENLTSIARTARFRYMDKIISLPLTSGACVPIIRNLQLSDGLVIDFLSATLFARQPYEGATTILFYGEQGQSVQLGLRMNEFYRHQDDSTFPAELIDSVLVVDFTIESLPQQFTVTSADGQIWNFIGIPSELCDRTWFLPDKIIMGTELLGYDGTEYHWRIQKTDKTWVIDQHGIRKETFGGNEASLNPPVLYDWTWADAFPEAKVDYDDSTWVTMRNPEEMTLLDCHYGYGWYRTEIQSTSARSTTLFFEGYADRLLLFANESLVGIAPHTAEDRSRHPSWSVSIDLLKGTNIIAVLADNLGKIKGDWQLGMKSMDHEAKGIFAPVYIDWNNREPNYDWKFRGSLCIESNVLTHPELDEGKLDALLWNEGKETAPQPGAIYSSHFTIPQTQLGKPLFWKIRLTGMTKGVIWLNGHSLGRYWTDNGHEDYYLPHTWLRAENRIVLFEEQTGDITKVHIVVDSELI